MTVSVQHRHDGDFGVAVIRGVGSTAAITHLCRSLACGSAFAERTVVIDFSGVATDSRAVTAPLLEATRALERDRRWLGVVDPSRPTGSAAAEPHVYRNVPDAVEAGQRYFRWVRGIRPVVPAARAAAGAVEGVASMVSGLPRAGAGWVWRSLWLWSRPHALCATRVAGILPGSLPR